MCHPPQGPFPVLAITGLANGAADLNLNWNLYDGQTPRLTQYAQPSAVSAITQDGAPTAQLTRVNIGDGGTLLAQYSNGVQTIFGQLAMATVRNPGSLIAVGNNNFQLGARSAAPAIGTPDTGGRGSLIGGDPHSIPVAGRIEARTLAQLPDVVDPVVRGTVDLLNIETVSRGNLDAGRAHAARIGCGLV